MRENQVPPSLGMAVRRYRLGAGLTQQELAGRAGISVRGLRDLEQCRIRQPRAKSVRSLADALALSPADRDVLLAFLTDTDAERPHLHIAVLGSMVLYQDGVPVHMRSQRQRALLGLLALHQGQTITTSEIIDTLWGEQPRRSAPNLVSMYANQLRTLLGTAGRSLRTTQGGYALDLADQQLDLAQFDDLVMRARAAQSAERPEQAADLYARALQCWRGPVLADAGDRLRQHPTAVAATQRRIAATVAFADVAVATRAADQVIAALTTLSREEPLHEAVHAQLMLALTTTGDQAAALRVFADLRSRLTDELGVEPGPEIQAAHLRILRGQVPHLGHTSPPVDNRLPAPVPAQLPAAPRHFTGRRDHLDKLDTVLAGPAGDTSTVVVITGTAGVGKTTLAVLWAHRVATQFPDGQLYVNLRGFGPSAAAMSPAEAMRGFLDALNVPPQRIPQSLDSQVGLFRSLLADRRVLILLDNARHIDQVRPLLPTAPGCVAVVTSRNQLSGLIAVDGAYALTLDVMSTSEARQLLTDRLGSHRIAAQPNAVDDIIAGCARLPLALAIVCARAAARPDFTLSALAGELGEAQNVAAFDGGDPATDIETVFSWSYRALRPDTALLFRLLGLHPGPHISAAAAASLIGYPLLWVRPLLTELTTAHLLAEQSPGRYAFHDLLRAYARHLVHTLHDDSDRHKAIHRLLDHYLHSGYTAALILRPVRPRIHPASPLPGVTLVNHADYEHAMSWFSTEHPNLIAAIQHAAETGFDTNAWQIAWTMTHFLDRSAHWKDWTIAHNTALEAARRSSDGEGQAHIHHELARAYDQLGRYTAALQHLQAAVDLFAALRDKQGQAHTHEVYSFVRVNQCRHEDALHHAQRALDLYRDIGDHDGEARALNSVGWAYAHLGDHRQAISYCERALAQLRITDRQTGEAYTWDSLGYSNQHLGRIGRSITCYRNALDLFRTVGDRYAEARTWNRLGDVHQKAGHTDTAESAWRNALHTLDEIHHPCADDIRQKLSAAG